MSSEAPGVEVCVVVVNYRTAGMVIDCLETLVPEVRKVGGKVALVDNASGDDSPERLAEWIEVNDASDAIDLIVSKMREVLDRAEEAVEER